MCGTAAAASSRSTVMRTISEPARAKSATCFAVASASAVSVLVIDCTTTGAPPPTVTLPTVTAIVRCLAAGPENVAIDNSLVNSVVCVMGSIRRELKLCRNVMDIASLGPVDEEESGGHQRHGDDESRRQWFVENKVTR